LCFAIGPSPTVRFSNFFFILFYFIFWLVEIETSRLDKQIASEWRRRHIVERDSPAKVQLFFRPYKESKLFFLIFNIKSSCFNLLIPNKIHSMNESLISLKENSFFWKTKKKIERLVIPALFIFPSVW
jgi:hypothetical protein